MLDSIAVFSILYELYFCIHAQSALPRSMFLLMLQNGEPAISEQCQVELNTVPVVVVING